MHEKKSSSGVVVLSSVVASAGEKPSRGKYGAQLQCVMRRYGAVCPSATQSGAFIMPFRYAVPLPPPNCVLGPIMTVELNDPPKTVENTPESRAYCAPIHSSH